MPTKARKRRIAAKTGLPAKHVEECYTILIRRQDGTPFFSHARTRYTRKEAQTELAECCKFMDAKRCRIVRIRVTEI